MGGEALSHVPQSVAYAISHMWDFVLCGGLTSQGCGSAFSAASAMGLKKVPPSPRSSGTMKNNTLPPGSPGDKQEKRARRGGRVR